MFLAQLWLSQVMAHADLDHKASTSVAAVERVRCTSNMSPFGPRRTLGDEVSNFLLALKNVRVIDVAKANRWLARNPNKSLGTAPASLVLRGSIFRRHYTDLYDQTICLGQLLAVFKGESASPAVTEFAARLATLRERLEAFEALDDLRTLERTGKLDEDLARHLTPEHRLDLSYAMKPMLNKPYADLVNWMVADGWALTDSNYMHSPQLVQAAAPLAKINWPSPLTFGTELDRQAFRAKGALMRSHGSNQIQPMLELLRYARTRRELLGGLPVISAAEEASFEAELPKLKKLRALEKLRDSGWIH